MWAVWTVDGLHYLRDLDEHPERLRWIAASHYDDTIDLSHARWAAGSAITALDLGAAAIGARHNLSARRPGQVHDVAELDQDHRGNLCVTCLRWVDAVVDDPDYTILESVRHPLTHRSLDRPCTRPPLAAGYRPALTASASSFLGRRRPAPRDIQRGDRRACARPPRRGTSCRY